MAKSRKLPLKSLLLRLVGFTLGLMVNEERKGLRYRFQLCEWTEESLSPEATPAMIATATGIAKKSAGAQFNPQLVPHAGAHGEQGSKGS